MSELNKRVRSQAAFVGVDPESAVRLVTQLIESEVIYPALIEGEPTPDAEARTGLRKLAGFLPPKGIDESHRTEPEPS